jgi:hypothetical protein
MLTPTFSLAFEKVRIHILVIDFQENSSDRFQSKFLFNLRRHTTLYDLLFHRYNLLCPLIFSCPACRDHLRISFVSTV